MFLEKQSSFLHHSKSTKHNLAPFYSMIDDVDTSVWNKNSKWNYYSKHFPSFKRLFVPTICQHNQHANCLENCFCQQEPGFVQFLQVFWKIC